MAKRGNPEVHRLLVLFLRFYADLPQRGLGQKTGLSQGEISRFEAGKMAAPEEVLRRMADAVGVPWSSVVHLRRCIEAVLSTAARWSAEPDDSEDSDEEEDLSASILDPVLLSVLPALIDPGEREEESTPEEEQEIRTALQGLPVVYRRRLLDLASGRAPGGVPWLQGPPPAHLD
jgi:transcriptional regulator with XRE-family HTH domain